MLRTEKENRIKLQTNIDLRLHHRFKTACFLQGKGMNEVLTELITWWLETDEGEFPPAQTGKPASPHGKKA